MSRATRVLLWLLGWSVLLVVVVIAITQIAVERSRNELNAYSESLEKRGEFLTIDPLIPPTPPAEDNGAPSLIAAMKELSHIAEDKKIPFIFSGTEMSPAKNVVGHLRDTARITGSKDVSWQVAADLLVPLEPHLAKIRSLAQTPLLEIQPDYRQGFTMPLVGVTESLKASQHLASQSCVLLHRGDLNGALANIEIMLKLAEFTGKQHVLISQLVASAILNIARSQTWEYLQSPFLSADQLSSLQNAWLRVHIADGVVPVLRMERACALPSFDEAASSFHSMATMTGAPTAKGVFSVSWDEVTSSSTFYLWRTLFRYADERQFIEDYQLLIDNAPKNPLQGPWSSFFKKRKDIDSSLSTRGLDRMFSRMVIPAVTGSLDRLISIQAVTNMVATAIALKRYGQATGSLPESLNQLVPAFLSAVPPDPFDGAPLRYRSTSSTEFLLYSIGSNLEDDHGDPSRQRGKRDIVFGADLVWPQPVSDP